MGYILFDKNIYFVCFLCLINFDWLFIVRKFFVIVDDFILLIEIDCYIGYLFF